jgi:diguanylate cyclase (GGDEF)-like protein
LAVTSIPSIYIWVIKPFVDARDEALAQINHLANTDGLTGLFNRRCMDIKVDQAWAESVGKSAPFALLMVDVDNFKNYNDYYGHQIGDDSLCAIAHAVKEAVAGTNAEALTKDAFAARYGGEEFTVVIPGASIDACERCATRIVESVRKLSIQHEQNGGWGIVTVSIGGCRRETSSGFVAKMFHDADEALYRAKKSGRNCIEFAD